jgi:hypothetical protein
MKGMRAKVNYYAFLLRLWRETNTLWHASLENPHTGERRAFATLEQLSEYLTQALPSGFSAVDRKDQAPTEQADVE